MKVTAPTPPRVRSSLRHPALLSGALALVLACVGTSEAGIVILKRGRVYVGVCRSGDVQSAGVWLNRPNGEQGRVWFPKRVIRWFDREAKRPTEAYFKAHAGKPLIGKRWQAMDLAYRQRRLRGQIELPPLEPPPLEPRDLSLLSPIPIPGRGYTLRKPAKWEAREDKGILMLKAPQPGPSGFRPRVHAFAVDTAQATSAQRLSWIQAELRRMAEGFGVAFRIVRQHKARAVEGGTEVILETRTHLKGRTVSAIRRVIFGARRTFVITAYVDDRDAAAYQAPLEAILESFQLDAR